MEALRRNDDEPWPGDVELPGARRARGQLAQVTYESGEVVTEPTAPCPADEADAVAHIGQPCTCVYAIRSDRGTMAYVEFDDGVRCYVYAGARGDCWFD